MCGFLVYIVFFFSSRRRNTRFKCDWSSDVCSSDLLRVGFPLAQAGNWPKHQGRRARAASRRGRLAEGVVPLPCEASREGGAALAAQGGVYIVGRKAAARGAVPLLIFSGATGP